MSTWGSMAFVFADGSSLGTVQVGMLKALVGRRIFPDFVVGSSVGANGSVPHGRWMPIRDSLANYSVGNSCVIYVSMNPSATQFTVVCRLATRETRTSSCKAARP
jgi:hypothetical protein